MYQANPQYTAVRMRQKEIILPFFVALLSPRTQQILHGEKQKEQNTWLGNL
jgi:hypothetical protein